MPSARLRDHVGRMNDATERLDKRRRRPLERRIDLDRIHRRHRNEFREATGQTGDAVFAIELTLVTVVSATIFTQHLASTADAIQTLIDHDAVAFTQIADCTSNLFDDAGDFMAENLWLQSKRDRLAVLVRVV